MSDVIIMTRWTEWKKGKVAPVHAVMAYRRRRSIAPLIIDLNTELKLVVNLMLWPLFPKQTALVPSK